MRRTAIVIILMFVVRALAAAEESPRFFIERIDVRNTRHASPAIIRAETRLHEGQTYSEADLREASYRVARLPFVLDAQYSLEKGSKRDAYVFVITVSETKPLFYDVGLNGFFGPSPAAAADADLAIGGRIFTGSRGVFYGGLGSTQFFVNGGGHSDNRTLQAGYTHYDLFGTRAFATIDLSSHIGEGDVSHSPDITALVGVPLSGNQTLTLSAGGAYEGGRTISVSGERHSFSSRLHVYSGSWSYNTTNSPFFPTRGVLLSATASRTTQKQSYSFFAVPRDTSYTQNSGTLSAAKYWEVSERNSVSATVTGDYDWTRAQGYTVLFPSNDIVPSRSVYRSMAELLTVDFTHNLLDAKATRARGDSRVGITATILHSGSRSNISAPFAYSSNNSSTHGLAGVWWARRNAWGMLRLGLNWASK